MSFSFYAHAIHHSLLQEHTAVPLKLGQVQQLLAAALGHKSLASYQNAQPPEDFGQRIIVNRHRLLERFNELRLPIELMEKFLTCFQSAASQSVYLHDSEYVKALMDFVRDTMPQVPEVQNYLARIGAHISFTAVDPIQFPEPIGLSTPVLHVVSATVELSTRDGRPHPTRRLFFDGCVTVRVCGRRCLGTLELSGRLDEEGIGGSDVVEYAYLPEDL